MGPEFEEQVEIEAPTVEEAVILGLTRLGITRDDASIEVLDEGSKGFLGLGLRDAHVRVARRPAGEPAAVPTATLPSAEADPAEAAPVEEPAVAPESNVPVVEEAPAAAAPVDLPAAEKVVEAPSPEPARRAESYMQEDADFDRAEVERVTLEVAEHLFGDLQLKIKATWREVDRPTLWLSLRGKDADSMVGSHARTLDAAQYIVRALVRRRVNGRFNLVVDADGYRDRRQKSLENLARKMADKAVRTGRSVRLRPMPASERRVIHVSLRKDARVRTESVGSGRNRAVTVFPVK